MSHDTDKLIRQLSLVAFLMAERRPLTARDVKGNVEGYSEMSDEAFARRFYSDRAELTGLGVPLHSQRDEFTGEELYTLRSENYFLDRLDLKDDELAALQTALFYLDGKFAYAEPLRLALQNLALGRPGFDEARTDTAERVRVSAPDYSPELAGRLSKLEAAISKQRTIKFNYWSPQRDKVSERTLNPYALRLDEGSLVRRRPGSRPRCRPHLPRLARSQRHPLRDPPRARLPASARVRRRSAPRPAPVADRRQCRQGQDRRAGRHGLVGASHARRRRSARRTASSRPSFARIEPLAGWVLRQNGRAIPLEPKALRDAVADGLALLREQHDGESPVLARERRVEVSTERGDRPVGPIAPERFGVLQALLAHVLSACGENRDARLDADDLAARFSIPREELQDTLSLLNLVNFGGGCYTVYAEVDEDEGVVRVDKELYGDVFRKPPTLTPLEARAIRLAIDYVGPTIAAEAHTPLDRVRKKLEETFGQFDLPQTLSGDAGDAEEQLVRTLSDAVEKRRVVEIEYLKEGDETPTTRSVEPYSFERELPVWRVHTWDRTADGPRTYRLDRMRSAHLTDESFEPREAFDPSYLTEPRLARLWHSPVVARWKVERGARLLTDKAALSELPFKTDEWLLSEVLADGGETVVLEPADMRASVAARARELQQELGVTVRRKRPAARA